jgi:hypothetical protein
MFGPPSFNRRLRQDDQLSGSTSSAPYVLHRLGTLGVYGRPARFTGDPASPLSGRRRVGLFEESLDIAQLGSRSPVCLPNPVRNDVVRIPFYGDENAPQIQ